MASPFLQEAAGGQVSTLTRTYVCPECGYDGFQLSNLRGTVDFNIRPGCPRCMTVDGKLVWLVETSDPRDAA